MSQIKFPKACFYCATTDNLEIHPITIAQTTKKSKFLQRRTEYHTSYAMLPSPVCKNCFKNIRMKGLDSIVSGSIMIIAALLIIIRILLSENIIVLSAIFWVIYFPLFFSGIAFLVSGIQIIRNLKPSYFIGGELVRNTEIYQNPWIIKAIVISTDKYAKIFQEMNPDIKIHVKHSKITPIIYSIFKTISGFFKPKKKYQ